MNGATNGKRPYTSGSKKQECRILSDPDHGDDPPSERQAGNASRAGFSGDSVSIMARPVFAYFSVLIVRRSTSLMNRSSGQFPDGRLSVIGEVDQATVSPSAGWRSGAGCGGRDYGWIVANPQTALGSLSRSSPVDILSLRQRRPPVCRDPKGTKTREPKSRTSAARLGTIQECCLELTDRPQLSGILRSCH